MPRIKQSEIEQENVILSDEEQLKLRVQQTLPIPPNLLQEQVEAITKILEELELFRGFVFAALNIRGTTADKPAREEKRQQMQYEANVYFEAKARHLTAKLEKYRSLGNSLKEESEIAREDFREIFSWLLSEVTCVERENKVRKKESVFPKNPTDKLLTRRAGTNFVYTLLERGFDRPRTDFKSDLAVARFLAEQLKDNFSVRTVMRWIQGGPALPQTKFKNELIPSLIEKGVSEENIKAITDAYLQLRITRGL